MKKSLFNKGQVRDLKGKQALIRDGFALFTAVYILISIFIYPNSLFHRTFLFGLYFSMVFMTYAPTSASIDSRVSWIDYGLVFLSLGISCYFATNLSMLLERRPFISSVSTLQIILAIITIGLLIEGVRRISGIWLPIINIVALIYLSFGQWIPGRFGHLGFSVQYVVDGLFLSRHGIWGVTMGAASGALLVIIIFSTFLLNSGIDEFLFKLIGRITSKSYGGFAKVAVLSSAFFGMISGGGASNVSATGTITIPAMIKKGYSPVYAAALESCASMASTFTPPVLGSVAFLMAEVVGLPYNRIAQAATIPAILFYINLFILMDIHSRKVKIEKFENIEQPSWISLFRKGIMYFIPLTYFFWRLMTGVSLARVGFESILVVITISAFNPIYRFNLTKIKDTLIKGIRRTLPILTTMASAGILIGVINLTGIASKFSVYLTVLSNTSIYFTLFLIMLVILFIGTAINTPTTYLISVVFFAPMLIRYGFEPLSVHMFILFYSAMGSITPPVAITALTAAAIANASPTKVGLKAMYLSILAYLLPMIFIFRPEVLGVNFNIHSLVLLISIVIGVIYLSFGIEGWFFDYNFFWGFRLLLILNGLILIFNRHLFVLFLGCIFLGFFVLLFYIISKRKGDLSYEKS